MRLKKEILKRSQATSRKNPAVSLYTIGDQQIRMALASFAQQGAQMNSRGHQDVYAVLRFQQQAMIVADT